MIKGWKLNPEWVRFNNEKKFALYIRKMERIKTHYDPDMLRLRELDQKANEEQQKVLRHGEIVWL